jgi:hypothetical protein
MLSDKIGMQLHDRETTGEPLTTQEKEQLEAWYVQQDAAEMIILKAAQMPLPNLVFMQDRIDAAISKLTVSVQRLQQITQENKSEHVCQRAGLLTGKLGDAFFEPLFRRGTSSMGVNYLMRLS